MKETFLICFLFFICFRIIASVDTDTDTDTTSTELHQSENGTTISKIIKTPKCWMTLRAPGFIDSMNKLDSFGNLFLEFSAWSINPKMQTIRPSLSLKYAKARQEAQLYFDEIKFDKHMLQAILTDGAVAQREVHKERPGHARIPSGMNLGGLCMVRMPFSVIFFHRMKLLYDTHFRIDILQNDMENMVLWVHLSLNTLCLKGAYDRSMTDMDPAALIYTPSFGELEVYLEDVLYAIEGRYRVIKNRLVIELILSSITCKSVTLKYANSSSVAPIEPTKLDKEHLGDFLQRLKTDLDKWIKDYINDYLIQTSLEKVPSIEELDKYDQEKATQIAAFTDNALELIKKKTQRVGGDFLHIPKFRIIASHGLTIQLKDGALRGLETMYRRSVATSVLRRQNLRYVDTIIGFSDLKISYKYEIKFPPGTQAPPPLSGLVIMSANELTAHLSLGLLKDPEIVDLDIDFINHIGPDAITVEGGANVLISNFKHLLKHEIATIMSSTLTYGIRMLKTLPKCDPFLPGLVKQKAKAEIVKIETEPMASGDSSSKDESTGNTISSEGSDGSKNEKDKLVLKPLILKKIVFNNTKKYNKNSKK